MDKKSIDKPTSLRKGEELDVIQLKSYLNEMLPDSKGELSVEQFANGFSNLTYLIRLGDEEMVLRRPPFGAKVKSGHNMRREYDILAALQKGYSKSPRPLLMCDDEAILGAPFYMMERVRGIILRAGMPSEDIPSPQVMGSIANSFVDALCELHQLNYQDLGLQDMGRPEGYVKRQIEGWTKRYMVAKTDDLPLMGKVASWLNDNMPEERSHSLIHNDYKYDNLVLSVEDSTDILAILDWEMATIGDPLMDFGTTLGYWIQDSDPDWMKALSLSPTSLPGNPTREELVQMYADRSGFDLGRVIFYYAYGLFKVAVIAQQIYYRYRKGLTQDERFARLGKAVEGLSLVAHQAIIRRKMT